MDNAMILLWTINLIIYLIVLYFYVFECRVIKKENRHVFDRDKKDLWYFVKAAIPVVNVFVLAEAFGGYVGDKTNLKMLNVMDIIIKEYEIYKTNNTHIFVADRLRGIKSKYSYEIKQDMFETTVLTKYVEVYRVAYYIVYNLEQLGYKADVSNKSDKCYVDVFIKR
jgi:hypothetical protein